MNAERDKSERDFQAFLDSISFADEEGNEVVLPFTEDYSDDPEGDREL